MTSPTAARRRPDLVSQWARELTAIGAVPCPAEPLVDLLDALLEEFADALR